MTPPMTTTTDIDAIRIAATFDEASEVLRSVHESVNRRERPLADYLSVHAVWRKAWGAEEDRRTKALKCQHLTTRTNYTGD